MCTFSVIPIVPPFLSLPPHFCLGKGVSAQDESTHVEEVVHDAFGTPRD